MIRKQLLVILVNVINLCEREKMIDFNSIKPGMFIRHDYCLIYFEIESICGDMVICSSRDPKKKTELVFFDKIQELVEKPCSSSWIKCNREKGFYDKFHPEGWLPQKIEVVKFEDLQEKDEIITTKGLCKLIKKISDNKWKLEGNQKTLSGKGSYISVLKQRETKPNYSHLYI